MTDPLLIVALAASLVVALGLFNREGRCAQRRHYGVRPSRCHKAAGHEAPCEFRWEL